jgi:hypothetical protein
MELDERQQLLSGIQKLINMLEGQLIKVSDSNDPDLLLAVNDELAVLSKKVYEEKFKVQYQNFFLSKSEGKDEWSVGNYQITYKPNAKSIFNSAKLENVVKDEDLKTLFFETVVKSKEEIEKICKENAIKSEDLFDVTYDGKPIFRIKAKK